MTIYGSVLKLSLAVLGARLGLPGPSTGKIPATSSAVFANRAVAWIGAHSLNATRAGAASSALEHFVSDFMAPGDPTHPGDFVATSKGVAIIHNK